jgi:hypothetical protein
VFGNELAKLTQYDGIPPDMMVIFREGWASVEAAASRPWNGRVKIKSE